MNRFSFLIRRLPVATRNIRSFTTVDKAEMQNMITKSQVFVFDVRWYIKIGSVSSVNKMILEIQMRLMVGTLKQPILITYHLKRLMKLSLSMIRILNWFMK